MRGAGMLNNNAFKPDNLQRPISLQCTRLRPLLSWGRAPQAPGEQSARYLLIPMGGNHVFAALKSFGKM